MNAFEVLRAGCSVMVATFAVGFFWARWQQPNQMFLDWLLQVQNRRSALYCVLGIQGVITMLGAMWAA